MKEFIKTFVFCGVAVLLLIVVLNYQPTLNPSRRHDDQGQIFYPQFTDPQTPKVIEVVDYDESTATARPLKVEYKNRRWSIPSHYGYPADAQERLAKTAATLVELKKDAIVSDRTDDHARYGVIDPLDPNNPSLAGRGKRVTLRNEQNAVLADFIIGKNVEGKAGFRYMRIPSQPRTYMVKTDAEPSARFQDWIETDLLKVSAGDIRKIVVNSYSINENMGTLQNVESISLIKSKGQWTLGASGTPRQARVDQLLTALANLKIVDVQPKPMGLSQDLKTPEGIRLSPESILSLRQKGFFVTPMGQLLSNEGEIMAETVSGLQYTLRFGEIAAGSSAAAAEYATAGKPAAEAGKEKSSPPEERRYLFITVNYTAERAAKYAEEGSTPSDRGKRIADELRNRFADWYYIISGAEFNRLRPHKKDLQ